MRWSDLQFLMYGGLFGHCLRCWWKRTETGRVLDLHRNLPKRDIGAVRTRHEECHKFYSMVQAAACANEALK